MISMHGKIERLRAQYLILIYSIKYILLEDSKRQTSAQLAVKMVKNALAG